jgi:tRNA 5-methylaminomethyl-2-thiouridine biosynthesis bifunctional protein
MWTAEVLSEVARLSKPGARLATYTAAGEVRRNLTAVGFNVVKTPGFGAKSEMTRATFHRSETAKELLAPWFARAPTGHVKSGHAAIIGSGLAGTATAHALN